MSYTEYNFEISNVNVINKVLPKITGIYGVDTRVLDIGCGNGELLHRLKTAGIITGLGLELSASGIKSCTEKGVNVKRFEIGNDDLIDEIEQFQPDLIICSEVIEHLYNPYDVFSVIPKCNADWILTFPIYSFWKILFILLTGKWQKHFNPHWSGGHIKFFRTVDVKRVLRDLAIENSTIEYIKMSNPFFASSIVLSIKNNS